MTYVTDSVTSFQTRFLPLSDDSLTKGEIAFVPLITFPFVHT